MDKCREAFEQLPEIKDSLSENIVFIGNKYTTTNEGFCDLVNWLNGGWYTWQSRQAEVDELQSQINEMAEVGLSLESELNKKDEHAHNLYYENANLQTLVEEKDKRIEEACESINSFFDNQVSTPTPREYANFIAEILETLRGEHE